MKKQGSAVKKKQPKNKKQANKSTVKNKDKLAVANQNVPRNKEKYPALNFRRQVKTRLDQLETDYIDKLSDEEKAWLNAFLEETVITNFQHKGRKFYKSKKAKREFYGSNNARNRCLFTKAKAMNTIVNSKNPQALQSLLDATEQVTASEMEDLFITAIEIKRSGRSED